MYLVNTIVIIIALSLTVKSYFSFFAITGEIMLERILTLIEHSGLSDAAFSQQVSIGNGIIGKWRSGKQKPSLDAVVKIADYFDVSIDYLVFGTIPDSSHGNISEEDLVWLELIHQLPMKKQYEFRGELIGYIKAMNDFQSM